RGDKNAAIVVLAGYRRPNRPREQLAIPSDHASHKTINCLEVSRVISEACEMIALKDYALGIIIVVLLTAFGMTKYELRNVKKSYSDYKESIDDQVQRALNEKSRTEAAQDAKYDKEKLDHAADRQRLNIALKRLRDTEGVSGYCTMPLAGNRTSGLSRKTEDTSGTVVKLATFGGTCDIDFYEKAMMQTLQCSRLIEFLR
ncbi:MAG: hypothetical protein WC236_15485, partial [Gallionellaceae bacterium]